MIFYGKPVEHESALGRLRQPFLDYRVRALVDYVFAGGEQQMLAIGRALMASPKVLLLDEPSLGLAPLLIKDIFDALVKIRRRGVSRPCP